jgi:hypothetical protein
MAAKDGRKSTKATLRVCTRVGKFSPPWNIKGSSASAPKNQAKMTENSFE